jgi:hypothetical protein
MLPNNFFRSRNFRHLAFVGLNTLAVIRIRSTLGMAWTGLIWIQMACQVQILLWAWEYFWAFCVALSCVRLGLPMGQFAFHWLIPDIWSVFCFIINSESVTFGGSKLQYRWLNMGIFQTSSSDILSLKLNYNIGLVKKGAHNVLYLVPSDSSLT